MKNHMNRHPCLLKLDPFAPQQVLCKYHSCWPDLPSVAMPEILMDHQWGLKQFIKVDRARGGQLMSWALDKILVERKIVWLGHFVNGSVISHEYSRVLRMSCRQESGSSDRRENKVLGVAAKIES